MHMAVSLMPSATSLRALRSLEAQPCRIAAMEARRAGVDYERGVTAANRLSERAHVRHVVGVGLLVARVAATE